MIRSMRRRSLARHSLCDSVPLVALGCLTWLAGMGPSQAFWESIDMGFAFVEQEAILVGDGRNDGVMRLYTKSGSSGGSLYEFSFGEGEWDKASFDDELFGISGIIQIGNGRNDGVNRLYVSGIGVVEYSFSAGVWGGRELGEDLSFTNVLVIGDAHNDGRARLYVSEWDRIVELTFDGGRWDMQTLDTGGQSMGSMLVVDARSDGVSRLYVAATNDYHIYEMTWSEGAWEVEDCGGVPELLVKDLVGGDGRNDGIDRIYMAGSRGDVYELSYDGTEWQYVLVGEADAWSTNIALAIGDGRNDGMNRLYVGSSDGGLVEYTFAGTWTRTSSLSTDLGVNGVAMGPGRNDGLNRLYVTADDNHVYEYSFEPMDRSSLAWRVTEIYVATMGYAPDAEGLAYWVQRIETDPSWSPTSVVQSFFDQPLVQAEYPLALGYEALVEALYRNIFGRAADAAGKAYWLGELTSGRIARNQMIVTLLDGGWANPEAVEDMARFGHQVQVGLAFAEAQTARGILYGSLGEAQQQGLREAGRAVLAGVTAEATTRDAAIGRIPDLLGPFAP